MNKVDEINWQDLKGMTKQERIDHLQCALLLKLSLSDDDSATASLGRAVVESLKIQDDVDPFDSTPSNIQTLRDEQNTQRLGEVPGEDGDNPEPVPEGSSE